MGNLIFSLDFSIYAKCYLVNMHSYSNKNAHFKSF